MQTHKRTLRRPRGQMSKINRLLPFTTAPLYHALQLMATGDAARFHMPGHKGEPVFTTYADLFAIDFTETYGTGNLYLGEGPIRDAEVAAACYFEAGDCFFLTGGSTQGVLAMLATAAGAGGSVLLDRGCHKSVCTACALLDLTPYFFSSELIEPFAVPGALDIAEAERQLIAHPEIRAVMLTSPTYYGVRRDIPAFADLCAAYGKKLLVDAAHGAHFPAVGLPTPIAEGADLAVLSIHKTLPCLGQGAALLMGDRIDRRGLRENTALFGTSSPSYPILSSIDLARAYVEGPGHIAYLRAATACEELRRFVDARTRFSALGTGDFPDLDPCRLTVSTAGTDMTGQTLSDTLWSEFGVACEMADERNAVFILTCSDTGSSLRRLRRALRKISRRAQKGEVPHPAAPFPPAERVLSVRQAHFSHHGRVPVETAAGMVCARPVTPYPPGIPLLWPGEKITDSHIELLQERWYNKVDDIYVVITD
ncbi:DegT/DnrJ/EryC1/StrS family aminotransferase [Butyricicoccus faecihominis]|uniref:aminotransferase class I/II-fold pyridoxal phosphate-dependent enzyme n=1 Tax=Butyricicoccus faecihominis TaxID=1712515 RepID=UPI00247ADDC6|nr:DegT/DnrJ/EryC1/StrS family aminotransferase [Butyricicoccus faecihominis]MCQ5130462.1 DegT/DnrJ/EryC1/StrS family aminotransferase [Butyricicoccus faecihominis]